MPSIVVILGTGGTIAGRAASSQDNVGYRAGQVGVQALVDAVPALAAVPAMVPPVPKTTHCLKFFLSTTCTIQKTGQKYSYWMKKQIHPVLHTGVHHV